MIAYFTGACKIHQHKQGKFKKNLFSNKRSKVRFIGLNLCYTSGTEKTKGVHPMKHNSYRYPAVRQPMYPGAADERYFAAKALEILAAVLSGTGAITAMLFLVTMA